MSVSHPKITTTHLQRIAYIYVRQSSMKQVERNVESQQYQYRLQQKAETLGWSTERIKVIDSDLGQSGRSATHRTGFQQLVTDLSLGHVGIIFGYDVSRLARNNRDWYHLLDLSAMFNTLIADNDGIYDPSTYNDRLLLGLKGTMSEAELHLLRQRLDAGRIAQVKRGAYRQRLPTGYIRLSDHTVVQDPDDQVRHVIGMLFAKFSELGSVNKVMRYFRKHNILLPRRQNAGPQANQLLWKTASEAAVLGTLKNPAYAGAFAYGRRQSDPTRRQAGRPATGRIRKPMDAWLHLQHDMYPAYITWEQFVQNQEQIAQNGLRFTENRLKAQGVEREGPGYLQGLVICGECGHHMKTEYKTTPRYSCRGLIRTTDAPSECCSIRAPIADEVVIPAFFEALRPANLNVLSDILAQQQQERDQLERQWEQRLQRAQYEVDLAQRQYDGVDPDNRLVAGELEKRWEQKLVALQQTKEAHHHFQQTPLPIEIPEPLRAQFEQISEQLPTLWPELKRSDKKRLLRSLISHVIVRRPVWDKIAIRIVWVSGHYTDHTAWTPILRQRDVTHYDQMVARIQQLWQERLRDDKIAAKLSTEGYHSARSKHVTAITVRKIRLENRWFLPFERIRRGEQIEGYLTVRQLAKRLHIPHRRAYLLIHQDVIPSDFVLTEPVYLIRDDPSLLEQLENYVIQHDWKRKSS